MMLVETLRNIANEANPVADTASYTGGTGLIDFTTLVSKTLVLSAARLVYLKFDYAIWGIVGGSSDHYVGARVLRDGVPIVSGWTSFNIIDASTEVGNETKYIVMQLAAGTYVFDFQASHTPANVGASARIKNIYIYTFDLTDASEGYVDSGTISCPDATETLLATVTTPTLSARQTAIGTIRKYTCIATVYPIRVNQKDTVLKDPGETNTSGKFNCKIYVDDVQVAWTEKDPEIGVEVAYGYGPYGRVITQLAAGASHTVKVKFYNTMGAAVNGRAVVSVVLCPWLLSTSNEPIDFTFPLGSTVYIMMEPVFLNPTKTLQLGRVRGLSWGSANDYYSTSTGVDRLSYNYTFEQVDPAAALLYLTGLGAAISVVAVDVR